MKNLFILIFGVVLLTGCYKDEGNYSYTDKIVTTIEGIEETYSAITHLNQTITITPSITSTDPSATFEYLWTIYPTTWNSVGVPPIDTIGTGKDLNFPVEVAAGSYTILYRVKNAKNGVCDYVTTTLSASSSYSTGFHILKETDSGNTEIDVRHESGTIYQNVLNENVGHSISGKPLKLGFYANYMFTGTTPGAAGKQGKAICPMSIEGDINTLLVEDYSLIYNHKDMLYNPVIPDEKPVATFTGDFFYGYYFTTKGGYSNAQYAVGATGRYGARNDIPNNGSLSSNIIMNGYGSTAFDEVNGTFIAIDYLGVPVACSDTANHPYPAAGISHKLLFMAGVGTLSSTTSGSGYAIFEDELNPAKKYIYKFVTPTLYNPSTRNIVKLVKELPATGSFFNNANLFGMHKSYSNNTAYIYGAVNDELYMCTYQYNSATSNATILETQLHPDGFGTGEEITLITNKTFSAVAATAFNYLIIATYKAGDYKIYMYNTVLGEPDGEPKIIITGKGRVKDIQYTHSSSTSSNYNSNL